MRIPPVGQDVQAGKGRIVSVRIDYQYRDGGNYGRSGSWIMSGTGDLAALEPHLTSDGFFVPDAVGLPMLSPGHGEWDDDIDHSFHTIDSVTVVEDPVDDERDFVELVEAFRSADWDRAAVDHAEGIIA
jgi:hypothetical protein